MFLRKVGLRSKAQLLPLILTQLTELLNLITAQTSLALRKLFRGWRGICSGVLRNRGHGVVGATMMDGLGRGGFPFCCGPAVCRVEFPLLRI
ncbi:hypothetical protein A6B35_32870 (plasmid) [Mesorhizobium amorphae CCNWGS0123]|nr:hypothetical protein A6B35_32870 [Mesorhizobium amorphae CCNWGS0123]